MANNLKQATKKSIYEGKVAQLDNLGTDIAEFFDASILNTVESIVGDFVERVHTNINAEENFVVTGAINDIEVKAENNAIVVKAAKHLIYQDRGVNGAVEKLYDTPHSYTDKIPPVQVFKDYIKRKNINLVNNEKYGGEGSPFKELTEEQLINKAAWGMATNVYKYGFKPRKIYSKEIPQLIQDLSAEISDFAVQSITQAIDVKEPAKRVIIVK